MAKITTPVKGFNGKVAGVTFVDGAGETEDAAALAYFERQGYTIAGDAAPAKQKPAAKGKAPAKAKAPAKDKAAAPADATAPATAEAPNTGDENADAGNGDGDGEQSTSAD